MDAINVLDAKKLIIENKNNSNFQIIDVRTPEEYGEGYIENAINIPLQELQSKLNEFDKNKEYLLYCRTQARSQFAHQILNSIGINSRFIIGGYLAWENNH